ncbi:MAG: hypothetical protein J6W61_06010 [Bacteroidales bacterium]|nr:hypothetical protein [Bacteroidales bacterium]MBP5709300.1 hypothetical protein [Bacteroidales bacterium]
MVLKFTMLSDEDETFVRDFEFLDTQTLLDFHNIIQSELEFDKSQLASFFTATDNWEKEEEFTLFDMGANSSTMEDTPIDDIIIRKNQKLLYIFDYFNERALYIEYVGEGEEEEGVIYPRCTNANGLPPKQITFGTRVRKQKSTNIVVTDEEDDTLLGDDISDVPGVEDLFINDDPDDSLSDFDDDFDDEEDDIIDDDISIDDLAEGEDDYI